MYVYALTCVLYWHNTLLHVGAPNDILSVEMNGGYNKVV